MKRKAKKVLPVRITYLEMDRPHPVAVPAPAGMALALMRASHCPVHFYRYLYEQVGRAHHWSARRKQSDDEVRKIIQSDTTLLHILYVDGCPAGFAETDLRKLPQAEIVCFGLMPDYQGRGLSRFFLHEVLAVVWGRDARKLIIRTNSLDSPRALQLYQKLGFVPVGTADTEVECWPEDH